MTAFHNGTVYGTEIVIHGVANFAGVLQVTLDSSVLDGLDSGSPVLITVMSYGSYEGQFERIDLRSAGGNRVLSVGCSVTTATPRYEARQLTILLSIDKSRCQQPSSVIGDVSVSSVSTAAVVFAVLLPLLAIGGAAAYVYVRRQKLKKQWSSVQDRLIRGAKTTPSSKPTSGPPALANSRWKQANSQEVELRNLRASLLSSPGHSTDVGVLEPDTKTPSESVGVYI